MLPGGLIFCAYKRAVEVLLDGPSFGIFEPLAGIPNLSLKKSSARNTSKKFANCHGSWQKTCQKKRPMKEGWNLRVAT